jgi:threonine dehydrogenase-like Zn-dependent dehydrogenase
MALRHGLSDVRAKIADGPLLEGKVRLHVECSGHEGATLDGIKTVGKRGEVVLIGVPWQRRTEIYAHELLHAIFMRYAVVRSGWEWEIPRQPADFAGNSIIENYEAAVRWIADGRLKIDGMADIYSPSEAQKVYTALADQSLPTPTALFDWRKV